MSVSIASGAGMGRRLNDRKDSKTRNRILWDSIPYKPGYIEAVAYDKGKRFAGQAGRTQNHNSRAIVKAPLIAYGEFIACYVAAVRRRNCDASGNKWLSSGL